MIWICRDLIDLLKPKHIIPSHGGKDKAQNISDLAGEMGYDTAKNVHIMSDGKILVLK